MKKLALLVLTAVLSCASSRAQVVINEIHYHPVENPHFDASGNPTFADTNAAADLSSDVHEFVELRNTGASAVTLTNWYLAGGIDYAFPAGATIPAGGFLVVAKNPARLQTVYAITGVLGPYSGQLSNGGDTVKLYGATGNTVDEVSYGSGFPWAITANALGAGDDFTGLNSANYQYKGRSLQRVSATASSNDPANWVAVRTTIGGATFADLPTPGAANIISRTVPKPVVTEYLVTQVSDGSTTIRASNQVKITATFSSTASLTNVQVEYFIDNINAFGEARSSVAMTAQANGQYTATLPGQIDRSIVRFRIKADRGDGVEVVCPRADDPAVVPVGAPTYFATPAPPNAIPKTLGAREPWQTYFVTPVRSSVRPIIDLIVSTDGSAVDDNAANNTTQFNGLNGLQAMAYDCKGSPKRTTAQDTAFSYPRDTPYVLASDRIFDDVVPAVFASNGKVWDIQIRMHRSRWNRNPSSKTFKVYFPSYAPYQNVDGDYVTQIFETLHGEETHTAHGLHRIAGLPVSGTRYIDWYFNDDADYTTAGVQPYITRLEQGQYDGELLDAYFEKMQRLNPGSIKEDTGEYYKSTGYFVNGSTNNLLGEGPYGNGNEWLLPAAGYWTELQRYDYTYALHNNHWKGAKPIRDLITGMWTARGDTHTAPNPNLTTLKAWFQANWDVDTELTALSVGNWMCPWDDTTQNHYLYHRANGTWFRVLWDFDSMYGQGAGNAAANSLYLGEVGDPGNNFRGPNYLKDSFIKAFRTEYKQRMWYINNTLYDPENLATLTYVNSSGSTVSYYTYISSQTGAFGSNFALNRYNVVNTLTALGTFYKPTRPTNSTPTNGTAVLPGVNFAASAYGYNAAYTHAAAAVTSPHAKTKWEIRAATGNYDNPVYIFTNTVAPLTTLAIPFGQLTYGQTYFWRVTYYDADGHPSITSAETSFSYGPSSVTAGNVSLNEIMAENHSAVANGTSYPDYVELKNNTGAVIDITGWGLTDDELAPNKYLFPATTTIPANGYLVVWCDSNTGQPGLHSGFQLSRHGQRVILTLGGTVKDAVTFGPQVPDVAIGRIADGTGAWTLVNPSAGAVNTARAFNSSASNVTFNEWMANPGAGSDWFELYNADTLPVSLTNYWLSDTPGTPKITQIPALSFVGSKNFAKFTADGTTTGFSHVNFKLSAGGSAIVLSSSDGLSTIASVNFGVQAGNVSQGRFPDGSATIVSFPLSASPDASNWLPAPIVINEALTNSTSPLEDAIELYNPTAGTVDISGWWLSDDKTNLKKFQIPASTTIPAGGYKVFYENQFNPTPGIGNSFSLSSTGDEVVLSAVDNTAALTGYRSQVSFGAAADGVAFGRVLTGSPAGTTVPEFWPLVARTFGQDNPLDIATFRLGAGLANAAPKVGPIVINEVMYHPPDFAGAVDNPRDEFIELHNITTSQQDISGWKLKGDADFTFAAGTIIRPGDYVLVVSFNPATDAASLSAFRTTYGLTSATRIYGPYSTKLPNDGADIELSYPGPAVAGVIPLILVDKVSYLDNTPWPSSADGNGPSLQRISRSVIGNDAANWVGATPTPGTVNVGQAPILDNDGDGIPNTWEDANGLDKFDAADASLDADKDGQSNLAEYLAGTNPNDPSDFLKVSVVKAPAAGGFVISFVARAGRSYTIQYKDALTDANWQTLLTVPAPASDTAIQQTDPTAAPTRFYRVRAP
jgi:hypothetical protein